EGTDGVQKMSKSYGNYIGINEPPQEIYGKVMSISDALMWRYYELLTDVKVPEIAEMKGNVAEGKQHPMELKKALARRIVQDFHGESAAKQADENWAKQFQKDEVPEDVECVTVKFSAVAQKLAPPDPNDGVHKIPEVRVDKMLHQAGLADSVADGRRKVDQSAVKIDGEIARLAMHIRFDKKYSVRVGKKLKNIVVENDLGDHS
ncbi:MAG TPA: tyrosine--tRNA ligase, partial [Verrucomicrobiae bacterium]|nr:tyrosine--tRNA ligase [Verrucomicrobiae bacterium]